MVESLLIVLAVLKIIIGGEVHPCHRSPEIGNLVGGSQTIGTIDIGAARVVSAPCLGRIVLFLVRGGTVKSQDEARPDTILDIQPESQLPLKVVVCKIGIRGKPPGEGCIHDETRVTKTVVDASVEIRKKAPDNIGVDAIHIAVVTGTHRRLKTKFLGPAKKGTQPAAGRGISG